MQPKPTITVRTVDEVSHQSRTEPLEERLIIAACGVAILALMLLTAVVAHGRGF
jgi:hypothetical protein